MKIITVTFVSGRDAARLDCAELAADNPDIDVIAIPSGLTQQGAWLALAMTDVVVIEEDVIRQEGFEAVRMLLAGYPQLRCLIVMNIYNKNKMIWTITQGVRGVMLHDEADLLLAKAIRHVDQGEIWLPRALMELFRGRLAMGDEEHTQYKTVAIADWRRWH
jgi:DNA-binding NarL/FixJ family response regulator